MNPSLIPDPPSASPDPASPTRHLTDAEQSDFGAIFPAAVDLVRRDGRVSLSALQQHFDVSHCRAIRMADAMERLGLVPPQLLVRPRARWRALAA